MRWRSRPYITSSTIASTSGTDSATTMPAMLIGGAFRRGSILFPVLAILSGARASYGLAPIMLTGAARLRSARES
jgi:hypothetical protein